MSGKWGFDIVYYNRKSSGVSVRNAVHCPNIFLRCDRVGTQSYSDQSYRSSKSSSSSHPPFLRLTTIFPVPPSFSLLSATAPRSSFNCSSVIFDLSWPDLASIINRFSISVARDSLTRRMRPRRSAASGVRIWERIELRASAVGADG